MENTTATAANILEEASKVPLLSPSAMHLLKLVGDPDHSLQEVVRLVECDAELTTHLLRRVNSAGFGLVAEVASVARAVTYLGERMVVGIALTVCSSHIFEKNLEGYESGKNALWEHSLKTAIAAREVVIATKASTSPDVAFTAGLLHDIGKSILSDYLKGMAGPILQRLDSERVSDFLEGEREILGTDHCEVGRVLAERWNIPAVLVQPMAYHHHPDQAPEENKPLVYAVHLGDVIAMLGGSGTGADSLGYDLNPEYTRYVELSQDRIGKIMLNVMIEFGKTMQLFS